MDDVHPANVHYGHLGDPLYDTKSQTWGFSRQVNVKPQLEQVGLARVAIKSEKRPPTAGKIGSFTAPQRWRGLLDDHPILAAASISIGTGEIQRLTASRIPEDPETNLREILAFTKAVSRTSSRHTESVPIIATAAGSVGNLVRLTALSKQQLGWGLSRGFGIQRFTAQEGQNFYWSADGQPVQQLCSAVNSKGDAEGLLAVRYLAGISILRPLIRRHWTPSAPPLSGGFLIPSSNLCPNEVIKLPWSTQGEYPFADVSFNPWDSQQLITVDLSTAWVIWNIVLIDREREVWVIERKESGVLKQHDSPTSLPHQLVGDGWARSVWTCNAETLMVASRGSISLITLSDDSVQTNLTSLVIERTGDWILDLKRSIRRAGHVFIVTSSRLLILNVERIGDQRANQDSGVKASCLFCWVHYRSPNDLSLYLTLTEAQIDNNKGVLR